MATRKTPILLRQAPLSGRVMALYRYSRRTLSNGREILQAHTDGKQDVTEDFESLMLLRLLDDGAEDIIAILDGAARGLELSDEERDQIRVLRERLREAAERHNERSDASATKAA